MKKVAIQLYGHLRSYKETNNSFFQNLVSVLNREGFSVDIFIHSWRETDTSEKSWHNLDGEQRGENIDEEDIEHIKQIYNPKSVLLEKQIVVDNDFEMTEKFLAMPRLYGAIINSSYTKYKVNELRLAYEKKENIEYDYVIQTRPDIKFHQEFGINKFLNTFASYEVPIPLNSIYTSSVPFRRGNVEIDIFLCSIDLIFFAKPEIMNKINYFYQDIVLNNITIDWINENLYSLEILWLMYWKLLGIEIVRLKYFQFEEYSIIRNIEHYSKLPEIKDASLELQEFSHNIISNDRIAGYKSKINWLPSMFGIFNTKDRITITVFFIKIAIKLTKKDIAKMAWWIPVRKWREKFRAKFN